VTEQNSAKTHINELQSLRKFTMELLTKLQSAKLDPQEKAELFGERESTTASLVKLSGILLKTIPLEHQLIDGHVDYTPPPAMTEEDEAIIKLFMKKEQG